MPSSQGQIINRIPRPRVMFHTLFLHCEVISLTPNPQAGGWYIFNIFEATSKTILSLKYRQYKIPIVAQEQ